ncbi:hypothetical protein [Microbacterium sp. AK031]|uniref:hypothetical protein n=1 Tax=Microbacterium sp. AK031 TaxID=2723076 RepID=UPI002169B0A3|nr:hypothetical protein [Microbacterium sp. AK031]MCS3843777.1 hypothetical protein [Microbacterium sp. AK031]
MTMTAPEPPRSDATKWEVIPLGHGAWRISDGSRKQNDPGRLVAYVDRNDMGTLEVLWLRSPCPTRSRYRDIDELLANLDDAVAAGLNTVSSATRPNEIPHFPPS